MVIEIITNCPSCREAYYVMSDTIGKDAECEVCGTYFTIEESTESILPEIVDLPYPSLTLHRVQAGTFERGNNSGYSDESPAHQVEITYDFWIAKYPVTQALFDHVMQDNPSKFTGDQHPVEQITWQRAQDFCYKLTQLAQHQLPEGFRFRLPTEAEWEYALLGNDKEISPTHLQRYAWLRENSGQTTHPVGEKTPNNLGLHDMLGNVGEWCLDWFAPYDAKPLIDPRGPSLGEKRVRRGGCYASTRARCRATDRLGADPSTKSSLIGFRVVLVGEG